MFKRQYSLENTSKGQSIHNEAGMMNPAKVLNALLAADDIGIERRLTGESQRLAAWLREFIPNA